jgi:hypothetical protein
MIVVKDTFTAVNGAFYQNGDLFTPTLSGGGQDLLVMQGNAQASAVGRNLNTADFGTQAWVQDQVGPALSLISFEMYRLALHIKNANIPTINSAFNLVWDLVMDNDGSGIGLHLENVDQTNPYVDQSATAGLQQESFASSVPTDLTFTCSAGDIVIYTLTNSTLDAGTITNFQRINRGALGGGSTGSPNLDEGATYYWIPGTSQNNSTIPAPVGSSSGYHSLQVYRASSEMPDKTIDAIPIDALTIDSQTIDSLNI